MDGDPVLEEEKPLEPGGVSAIAPGQSGRWSSLGSSAARSGALLTARLLITLGASFVSGIATARALGPQTVGEFALVLLVTQGILGPFGDLGLRAALVRKSGDLESRELWSCHIAVLSFSIGAAIILAALLPLSLPAVGLDTGSSVVPAVTLLALLVIRNGRVVPLSVLERNLRFKEVGVIESVEALLYGAILSILAYRHAGVWSWVIAIAVRDCFGSSVMWARARVPWGQFSFASVRPHLGFSLQHQAGAVLNLIGSSFLTAGVGRFIGTSQAGFMAWAGSVASYPQMLCNTLGRVYLPVFSRVARQADRLAGLTEAAIKVNSLIVLPAAVALAVLQVSFIPLIFGKRWLPASPALVAFCLWLAANAVGGPITELFNAVGRVRYNLFLTLCWAVLLWGVGPIVALTWGFRGVAILFAVLQLTWIWAFWKARQMATIRTFQAARPALQLSVLIALMNGAVMVFAPPATLTSLAGVAAANVVVWLAYAAVVRGAVPASVKAEVYGALRQVFVRR